MKSRFGTAARRWDRIATVTITASGIVIIGSVIGIMVLIVRVALPLFLPPETEQFSRYRPAWLDDPAAVRAIGTDEYQESSYLLLADGTFVFFDAAEGDEKERLSIEPPGGADATIAFSEIHGDLVHTLQWSDGAVSVVQVRMVTQFDEQGRRSIRHQLRELGGLPPRPGALRTVARPGEAEGALTVVTLFPGNRLEVIRQIAETDIFGNVTTETRVSELRPQAVGTIGPILLDNAGEALYAGTDSGFLLHWALEAEGPRLADRIGTGGAAITALAMVIGDDSVAVGWADGRVSTWFPVPAESSGDGQVLKEIHPLAGHEVPVVRILPSAWDKTLVSVDAQGVMHQHYPTGEERQLTIRAGAPLAAVGYSLRTNAVVGITSEGRITHWTIDNPHPDFSWKAALSQVWYEGFPEPGFVWQSSAATDDAEPKLSLIPLIFGTLKGTFYALLVAGPLAVLAAVYTSSLMDPRLRLVVKPTVEIMAAVPTVVIGFLAALWFAPLIEDRIVAVFLFIVLLPAVLVGFVMLWDRVQGLPGLKRVRQGYEFLLMVPAVVLSLLLAVALGDLITHVLFGGDFRLWMYQTFGTRVDQRNSIVIAFALGFAVIPTIFTIAEDALIRVPGHLRAASLALGATRWQTAWLVVLPSASPGIFAAVMIGFGRAVGETMIVLMATGNTPIIDMSIFNGMRTLSANIAVEIPEAPAGGTLYRVLFLTGVILFTATFLVNTAAEVVRERLRRKYGRL